ncbi:hypothetical protein G5I_14701 [Acromyrmex echinatior]|uniref:Uncharacterized protein n=1 Tax=Acromyrmex echinatior TaxID=103372 RepID=F4X8G2_ACREC|nr:hypothetical protein G5I_14701 [Acromyrmex echinatior]
MSTEIFQRAPLLLQLAPNVCLPAKRRVKCEMGALQVEIFPMTNVCQDIWLPLKVLVHQSIRVVDRNPQLIKILQDLSTHLSIPSSSSASPDRSFVQELAFPRFAEGFSQMLFDGMHEGHEKRDGDRRELKQMSQSGYCFRSTYSNGNRNSSKLIHKDLRLKFFYVSRFMVHRKAKDQGLWYTKKLKQIDYSGKAITMFIGMISFSGDEPLHPLSYSSDKHISFPALSIFTLARRAIDLFPFGLSYHSRTQNNPPTKFDCLFRISSFIELYRQGSKLNNLTKPFFPCCFTQMYISKEKTIYREIYACFKNLVVPDRLASNATHSNAWCSCVTEGNSIAEATQTHDEKEPFVISGFTASFTEFH